jgi:hypothetical protein
MRAAGDLGVIEMHWIGALREILALPTPMATTVVAMSSTPSSCNALNKMDIMTLIAIDAQNDLQETSIGPKIYSDILYDVRMAWPTVCRTDSPTFPPKK